MILQDAIDRLFFKIGTPDDSTGRALNPIVKNSVLVNELQDQLRSYANVTKGIQDIYSFSLSRNTPFVEAPTLALRSRGYFYAYVIVNGTIFPMDFRGARDVFPNFRVNPVNGITNWIMPWNAGRTQYFGAFPTNSSNAKTTTLSADIVPTDTTLTVASTTGFINNFGRITIGSEKILYEYKDSTHFYNCVRGVEMTTAANHVSTVTITENNVILFYSRLPWEIPVTNETIPPAYLAKHLDPCDEHMEGILKATTYNLLIKFRPESANMYKTDTMILYDMYAKDIAKGYARNRQNINIRDPYAQNESGIPYGTNILY